MFPAKGKERTGKPWFAVGAMSDSAAWFHSPGFGARVLSPLFLRPMARRALDGMIGAVMPALAGTLAFAAPAAAWTQPPREPHGGAWTKTRSGFSRIMD